MLKFLDGKKTWLAIAGLLVCVALEKLLGVDVPGFDASQDWLGYILAALGLGGLRSAIAKVE